MARTKKTVIVSDLSGNEVPDSQAVRIAISFADRSRGRIVLDASEDEVAELVSKGRPARGRGRRRSRSDGSESAEKVDEDLEYVPDDE